MHAVLVERQATRRHHVALVLQAQGAPPVLHHVSRLRQRWERQRSLRRSHSSLYRIRPDTIGSAPQAHNPSTAKFPCPRRNEPDKYGDSEEDRRCEVRYGSISMYMVTIQCSKYSFPSTESVTRIEVQHCNCVTS